MTVRDKRSCRQGNRPKPALRGIFASRVCRERLEAAVALQTIAFAAPDDVAASEGADPQGELKDALLDLAQATSNGSCPGTGPRRFCGQSAATTRTKQRAGENEERPFRRLRGEPEQRPKHGVAEDARGVGQGVARRGWCAPSGVDAPTLAPVHRRGWRQSTTTGAEGDALAGDAHDAVAGAGSRPRDNPRAIRSRRFFQAVHGA